MWAIKHALSILNARDHLPPTVNLYTDSQVSLQTITSQSSSNVILNDLASVCANYMSTLSSRGTQVYLIKVSAHEMSLNNHAKGNHMADILAGLACTGYLFQPTFKRQLPRVEETGPLMGLCYNCSNTWLSLTDALRQDMRTCFYKKPPRDVPLDKIITIKDHPFILD